MGGLSVLRHIRAQLPQESVLYVADSLHAPYGDKSADTICQRAEQLTAWLIDAGAKAIVVACNTATAAAVSALRAHYALPVIGMEPAVKPAVAATRNGVVGVLATTGTLKSAQFAALLDTWGKNVRVVTQAGHGLVECVERGELTTPATRARLRSHLAALLDQGADTVVLGCTHYPFLRPLIEDIVGPDIALIDTGHAVARQVVRVLTDAELIGPAQTPGTTQFWTTAAADQASRVMSTLWGEPVTAHTLDHGVRAS